MLCSIESMKSAYQLELSQELQKLKNSYKLQEQQWVNKEYEYKKKIQQLETRVCTHGSYICMDCFHCCYRLGYFRSRFQRTDSYVRTTSAKWGNTTVRYRS